MSAGACGRGSRQALVCAAQSLPAATRRGARCTLGASARCVMTWQHRVCWLNDGALVRMQTPPGISGGDLSMEFVTHDAPWPRVGMDHRTGSDPSCWQPPASESPHAPRWNGSCGHGLNPIYGWPAVPQVPAFGSTDRCCERVRCLASRCHHVASHCLCKPRKPSHASVIRWTRNTVTWSSRTAYAAKELLRDGLAATHTGRAQIRRFLARKHPRSNTPRTTGGPPSDDGHSPPRTSSRGQYLHTSMWGSQVPQASRAVFW